MHPCPALHGQPPHPPQPSNPPNPHIPSMGCPAGQHPCVCLFPSQSISQPMQKGRGSFINNEKSARREELRENGTKYIIIIIIFKLNIIYKSILHKITWLLLFFFSSCFVYITIWVFITGRGISQQIIHPSTTNLELGEGWALGQREVMEAQLTGLRLPHITAHASPGGIFVGHPWPQHRVQSLVKLSTLLSMPQGSLWWLCTVWAPMGTQSCFPIGTWGHILGNVNLWMLTRQSQLKPD